MPNFVLLGAAGFVAPRHMQAIKDVGGNLLAVMDPHDSVGVIDAYFKGCRYFREFERFERFCDNSIRSGVPIDYVSVCSPNYLHDSHIRFGLRIGANVVCEKPVVVHERNLDSLLALEKETGRSVFVMFQLRFHPKVAWMQRKLNALSGNVPVEVNYSTPRGEWYLYSWKGDVAKSGGLATNIGCHLFDVLSLFFGDADSVVARFKGRTEVAGIVEFGDIDAYYRLSINMNEQPNRVFRIGDDSLDLSDGFSGLHTEVYRAVLQGEAPRLEDARSSVRITEAILNQMGRV